MSDLRSAATCPKCRGSGEYAEDHGGTIQYDNCPACGGTGLAGLEAAAKAMAQRADDAWNKLPEIAKRNYLNQAHAVIFAWLTEIERTE